MNYKKYWIFLSFSLVFAHASCLTEERATQEEIYAVEEIPAPEDLDFDLDNLNTTDVNNLLEQVKKIEELPHETTLAQDFALVRAFFEMKIKDAWDEFKNNPILYSAAIASIMAITIWMIKTINSKPIVYKPAVK